ncbi:MAG: hypothetical protein AB1466_01210 [Actinomycetota bacterium]
MPKVILFHYEKNRLPKLSAEELKKVRDGFLEELKNYPPGIRVDTYVDEKGMGICDWEVPEEVENPVETVKKIVEKVLGSPPADPVVEVKKVL